MAATIGGKGGWFETVGWLVGGERASPYKALPRGSSATVSLVENIRRRGKTRVSRGNIVSYVHFRSNMTSDCRMIDAPFRDSFRWQHYKSSRKLVRTRRVTFWRKWDEADVPCRTSAIKSASIDYSIWNVTWTWLIIDRPTISSTFSTYEINYGHVQWHTIIVGEIGVIDFRRGTHVHVSVRCGCSEDAGLLSPRIALWFAILRARLLRSRVISPTLPRMSFRHFVTLTPSVGTRRKSIEVTWQHRQLTVSVLPRG